MADQNSWTIAKRPHVPFVSFFSDIASNAMDFVPILDVWPFAYSGSFKLKEGQAPVLLDHKDFYKNYQYVGPFPDVDLSIKEVETRLIKWFMEPIEPLI
jgi:hypothetical protein